MHESVGCSDENAIDSWNSESEGTLVIQYDYVDQLGEEAEVLVYVGIPDEGISYFMWSGVMCMYSS